tara:strand:+ start:443 stop:1546 length:1104 start_codon:yes stop_codon:yes gene_type:complete
MRAAVFSEPGKPMNIEDLVTPEPLEHEVRIKVEACGVCHTDLHVLKGEVAFPTPGVLGHEVSGIVDAVGANVSNVSPGDQVACSFIMPCGYCNYCIRGREDLCETFFSFNRLKGQLYDGTTRLYRSSGTPIAMYSMGGLAEYAVTPDTSVFKLPSTIPLDDAAIIGCSIFTAYGAVRNQADIRPGQRVAVFAIGGVGTQVLQMARAFGASQVIAVDIKPEKLESSLQFGATHTINSLEEDVTEKIKELTEGKGVDVAIEALGSPITVKQAFNSVRDGGKVVLIGIAAAGVEVPLEITRFVRRGVTVVGSYGARARRDMPEVINLVQRGELDTSSPITRRYSLDQVNEAYEALAKGEIIGRAIIEMRS